jgi:hypothetical protein
MSLVAMRRNKKRRKIEKPRKEDIIVPLSREHRADVMDGRVTPDGKVLMTIDCTGRVLQRDARTSRIWHDFDVCRDCQVLCVASFSADTTVLYTCDHSRNARMYSVGMGHCTLLHERKVTHCCPRVIPLTQDRVIFLEKKGPIRDVIWSTWVCTRSFPCYRNKRVFTGLFHPKLSSDGNYIVCKGRTSVNRQRINDGFYYNQWSGEEEDPGRHVAMVLHLKTLNLVRLVYTRGPRRILRAVCVQHQSECTRAYTLYERCVSEINLISGKTIRTLRLQLKYVPYLAVLSLADDLLYVFENDAMMCIDTVAWSVLYVTRVIDEYQVVHRDVVVSELLQHTSMCTDVCNIVTAYM